MILQRRLAQNEAVFNANYLYSTIAYSIQTLKESYKEVRVDNEKTNFRFSFFKAPKIWEYFVYYDIN